MVSEHLPMVFATLLNVDDQDLLHPESQLGQNVSLHQATHLPVRPVGPELLQVQEVRGLAVDVL